MAGLRSAAPLAIGSARVSFVWSPSGAGLGCWVEGELFALGSGNAGSLTPRASGALVSVAIRFSETLCGFGEGLDGSFGDEWLHDILVSYASNIADA